MSSYQPWKSFEREVVRELRILGFDSKRNWHEQFGRTGSGCDIVATDGEDQLIIQCKYGTKPNILQAFVQAKSACTSKKAIPLALTRYKGKKLTLVSLEWKDFKRMLEGEW